MRYILFFLFVLILFVFIGYFPTWFDTAEFATAISHLGVSHPSGHPTYIASAHLLTYLPLGTVAFRTNMYSAILSSVGLTLSFLIVLELLLQTAPQLKRTHSALLGSFVAFLLFLHPSIALQSTRTEVYAPQFALSLMALYLVVRGIRSQDERYFMASVFIVGLAIGLNPLLTAILIPAVIIPWIYLARIRLPKLVLAASLCLTGFGTYLLLPLRAVRNPVINWDAPAQWDRFWGALIARDFHIFFHSPVSPRAQKDWLSLGIFELLPPLLFLLALLGGIILLRRRHRPLGLCLLSALVMTLLAWLSKDFYLKNPDSHAYVSLPIALSAILAVVGIFQLLSILKKKGWQTSVATALLLLLFFLNIDRDGFSAIRSNIGTEAEALSRHLDYAPPAAILEVTSDHWLFPLWYRTYVEGRRPDVAIVGTGLTRASWYRKQIKSRHDIVPRRIWWKEIRSETEDELAGYLFTFASSGKQLRERFNRQCRMVPANDPFDIRGSICARVVTAAASGSVGDQRNYLHAVALLESYLEVSPTATSCDNPEAVNLPYPLARNLFPTFLPEPGRVVSDLALLYLICGHPETAYQFLQKTEGDLDAALLYGYLLSFRRGSVAASRYLESVVPEQRQHRGVLAIAQATLHLSHEDFPRAELYLSRAKKLFGEETEAIRNLETRFQRVR